MFPFEGFDSFLLVCDVFSHKIFAEALPNKSAQSVIAALKKIFQDAGTTPEMLQSDQGVKLQVS
jgi:hypothetical protein